MKCYTEVRFFKWKQDEVSVSLRNRSGSYGGGSEVLIVQDPIVFRDDITIKIDGGGVAFTVGARDHKGVQCVMQRVTGTLNPGAHPGSYNGQDAYNDMLIAEDGRTDCDGNRTGKCRNYEGGCPTLNTTAEQPIMAKNTVVRRLTPKECERLQGFPDDWTDIGEWTDSTGKKRQTSDTNRYKALGNSIALPYWKVLARRIAAQYDRDITMGSLFDGISGFCVAFAHTGATPVWSSEIEEFCIAVCKKHFGDEDDGTEGDYKRFL